jgi:hypothetical protein
MPRYRLTTPHFSEEDKLIEASDEKPVEVGDGTMFKWTRPPTPEMQGLDEESRALVEREKVRCGEGGMDPLSQLKMTGGEAGDIVARSVPIMNHPNERPTPDPNERSRSPAGQFARR